MNQKANSKLSKTSSDTSDKVYIGDISMKNPPMPPKKK